MSDERPSRLNQRHLGVKTRIWLILFFFLALLAVTHHILPQTPTTFQPYSTVDLHSKNYLNNTAAEPNPFAFCPVYGPGDAVGAKHGALTLSQSRMHLGSSARVNRVINRALAGQPVTISVIGGSVSACHGAGDDPVSPHCYPSRFFQWWNSVFPHPASELTNGAMRRTNSAYYGYCSMHHVPDITDLVIVELDSDDDSQDMMEHFEVLIRSLLIRPDQPAVILLGHFAPQVHQTHGFAGPDQWHNVVAQFYDVAHISTKSSLYSDYMSDPDSVAKFFADPVLASPAGHELLTDVLIAYFQAQICAAWDVVTGSSFDSVHHRHDGVVVGDTHGLFGGVGLRKGVPEPGKDLDDDKDEVDAEGNRIKPELPPTSNAYVPTLHVPPARINTRPKGDRPFEEIDPFCVSANDLINPLPPSLFYGSGWYANHPKGATGSKDHYWYSTLPLSRLRIPIQVGAGDVGVYYLQESASQIGEGSGVECWVDDNYAGARVLENAADVGEPTAKFEVIDHFVTRGSHFVECQLLGEEGQSVPAFRIVGIFST